MGALHQIDGHKSLHDFKPSDLGGRPSSGLGSRFSSVFVYSAVVYSAVVYSALVYAQFTLTSSNHLSPSYVSSTPSSTRLPAYPVSPTAYHRPRPTSAPSTPPLSSITLPPSSLTHCHLLRAVVYVYRSDEGLVSTRGSRSSIPGGIKNRFHALFTLKYYCHSIHLP